MNYKNKRIILSFKEGDVSASQFYHLENMESLLFQDLLNESLNKGKSTLFNFLKTRPRSSFECQNKLKNLGFLDSEIESLINEFQTNKILDDKLFAQYLIESVQSTNPFGELSLKYKLKEKGIDQKIIDSVLDEYFENEDIMIENAKKLIHKNLYRFEKYHKEERKHKIYRYLYSRGFEHKTIENAIDKLY